MNKKVLKYAIRVILSVVALYIIISKVDLTQAWNYLQRAKWGYLILSFLSFFISKVIAAFRLNSLYRTQELILSEKLNLKLNFLGMFYNLFIPLVGGEGYKAFWIKKHFNVRVKKLVSSALLDRASGLVALCLLTVGFFWYSHYDIPYKPMFFLAVPLIYFGHWLVLRLFFKSFLPSWGITSIYSFFVQVLQAATTYFIILAIGIDQHILDYIFVFLLSCFAFVLPMIGAREMAFVFGADYLGLNMELSLAISLLFYLSLALSSLSGAYFVLVPRSLEKELRS